MALSVVAGGVVDAGLCAAGAHAAISPSKNDSTTTDSIILRLVIKVPLLSTLPS